MGVASGIVSQFGIAEETTAGTRVVPTRFFEYTSETIAFARARIISKAMRAGRVLGPLHWAPGIGEVKGPATFECAPQGFGLLLKHMFGPNVTTGAGPYTHTFAGGGNLDGVTFTVQIGRPGIDGTVNPFDYLGMAITDWSLDAEINQFLMMTCTFYGMTESTANSLASASYPSTIIPFTFLNGSLTIAAAAQDVTKFTLGGSNNLVTGRHQMRATTPEQPKAALQGDRRAVTGSFSADFASLTAYNRYVNGTEAAMALTFVSGANSLTITMNVRFDGTTPSVNGPALVGQDMPFVVGSTTSDAAAFTAVLINGDSAP